MAPGASALYAAIFSVVVLHFWAGSLFMLVVVVVVLRCGLTTAKAHQQQRFPESLKSSSQNAPTAAKETSGIASYSHLIYAGGSLS